MARRAFDIDTIPPPPLSTEETAAKYGVSKTALNDIKSFVDDFVSVVEAPGRTKRAFVFGGHSKSVSRTNVARSRKANSFRRAASRKK